MSEAAKVYAVYDAAERLVVGANVFFSVPEAEAYIDRLALKRGTGEPNPRALHIIEVPASPAPLEPEAPEPIPARLEEHMASKSRGSESDPLE